MRVSGPGPAHPKGIRKVSLVHGTDGYPLKPVPRVHPTSPAMMGQCRGAIPAWGKDCRPSLDVPRRVQKPGLERLQLPTVTEPRGTILLAAPASLGSAVDGRGWNSLGDVKANLFFQHLLGS